jgi:hypothetical protein
VAYEERYRSLKWWKTAVLESIKLNQETQVYRSSIIALGRAIKAITAGLVQRYDDEDLTRP